MVPPTRGLLVGFVAVAMAGAGYFATQPDPVEATASSAPRVTASPTASSSPADPAPRTTKPRAKTSPKPKVDKSETYVEVYNNSGINGLAAATSARAQGAGWRVVGSDNWVGTIPATTVYYPERLHPAAKKLARDLNIARLRPAIEPMRFDRLTVILTGDYS